MLEITKRKERVYSNGFKTCTNLNQCINPKQGSLDKDDYAKARNTRRGYRNTCKMCCNFEQRYKRKSRSKYFVEPDPGPFIPDVSELSITQQFLCGRIGHAPR